VPFDEKLVKVFTQKQFWVDYFLMNEEGGYEPVFPGVRVELPLPGGHTLLLRVYERGWEKTLHLAGRKRAEPILLARNTANFFEPWYVFRWQECAAICRCLAAREGLRHPGWPLLLLSPFTTIKLENDRDALEALRAAWRWTGLLAEEEIRDYLALDAYRARGVQWVGDGSKWVLAGDTTYSLRTEGNDSFPFALFEDLIARALRCVAGGRKGDAGRAS
jgi:hypothetical protein